MTPSREQQSALADWRFPAAQRLRTAGHRRPVASAGQAIVLASRELRLVFAVLFVMFVTSEFWQAFGRLGGLRYFVLLTTFIALAGVFGAVGGARAAGDALALNANARRSVPDPARATLMRRLRRRAWFEIVVVGLAFAGGFFLLGVLVVDSELTRAWGALDARPVELYVLPALELVVSVPLARVAGVLGALAALLFALEVLVDPDMRHDVFDDLLVDWEAARTAWERQA